MLDPKKKVKKYAAVIIVLLILAVSFSGMRIQSVKQYREEQERLADDIIIADGDDAAFREENGIPQANAVRTGMPSDTGVGGDALDSRTGITATSDSQVDSGKKAPQETASGGESSHAGTGQNAQKKEQGTGRTKRTGTSAGQTDHSVKRPGDAQSESDAAASQKRNESAVPQGGGQEKPKKPETEKPKEPETEKPQKSPEASQTPPEEQKEFLCGITIRCDSILSHLDEADEGIIEYIPEDGMILGYTEVKAETGDTAYSLLQKVCQAKGIALDSTYTNAFSSAYVRGIGNIYEKQVGLMSGWLYLVNGSSPGYGASRYPLQEGDQLEWVYTCTGKLE